MDAMIRVAMTRAALTALVRTQPPGTVDSQPEVNDKGEWLVWMEEAQMWRLASMRGLDESLSDVIVRVVARGQIL
jgi:hypothetical protein